MKKPFWRERIAKALGLDEDPKPIASLPKAPKQSRKPAPKPGKYPKSVSITDIPGWNDIRNRILERDNYQCRICGADGAEAKLNVHHKDWNRLNNKNKNLVTLCQKCHKAVHTEGYQPDLFEDWPEPWGQDPAF